MKDKLMEKVQLILVLNGYNPALTGKVLSDLLSLLTSEVENALIDLKNEYTEIQNNLDEQYGEGNQEPHYLGILENKIEEQRKALSDIGGGNKP